jgi:type I restriction enzyme S subunit
VFGYVVVSLEDVAVYVKNRINLDTINEYNYVGVDNLLQNKAGKKVSEHIPTDGKVIEFKIYDILIGNIRPYLKKIWLADCDGGTNGDVLTIRIADTEIVNSRFLYYVLSSDKFFDYDNNNAKGAKMPRGDKNAVMKYQFQLPPIKEQQRIVDILDRFDKLCNDISEGLPAEIDARKKQYEYYRDKLLNFE